VELEDSGLIEPARIREQVRKARILLKLY